MKHTFKDWLIATRFWSFPVSAMPVIVTVAFLMWKGYDIKWMYAVPSASGNIKAASGYFTKGREAMIGLDRKTAGLHMIFSILLAASLFIASLISNA